MTSTSYERISPAEHKRWIAQGYQAADKGVVCRWGKMYTLYEYRYDNEKQGTEKTGRFALGLIGYLSTFGTYQRLVYNKTQSDLYQKKDIEALGFDFTLTSSLRSYCKSKEVRARFKEAYGHYFWAFECPQSGATAIILIPNKNWNMPRYASLYSKKDGRPCLSWELEKKAVVFCGGFSLELASRGVIRVNTHSRSLPTGGEEVSITSVETVSNEEYYQE